MTQARAEILIILRDNFQRTGNKFDDDLVDDLEALVLREAEHWIDYLRALKFVKPDNMESIINGWIMDFEKIKSKDKPNAPK